MTEVIYFSMGILFATIVLTAFAFLFKHIKTNQSKSKNDDLAVSPEQDKKQKELERQYNNLMNYDGRTQRGVNDED